MAVILDFKKFYKKVVSPHWYDPYKCVWWTLDGQPQSFLALADRPGLFNLAWLSLDVQVIPEQYNLRANDLAIWTMLNAGLTTFGKTNLEEYAAMHSLGEFAQQTHKHPYVARLLEIARRRV